MKTSCILILSLLLLSFNSFTQTAGSNGTGSQGTVSKKGWSPEDRADFITECIDVAKKNFSEDSARSYCYCMQEKVELKYPDIKEADKLTTTVLQSPEWQAKLKDCLSFSKWSDADRYEFLDECIQAAKESIGEKKANSYCGCMLYKIERMYPDPKDTDKLTDEVMAGPTWKKIIQACLDF